MINIIANQKQHLSDTSNVRENSARPYIIGFILSIILTIIPFWMVTGATSSKRTILATVITMAIIQIFVHLIYFMHTKISYEECWNLVSLIFTTVVIAIIIAGSLWIMYHLNMNMMDY
ncbi:cytochrome o ubiquinol oxidase subunit IV [Candidatus Profftia tarda]|nr:cytochrome o ubiquinol oxidase subunit IV [Candidatus Profftia tarda]